MVDGWAETLVVLIGPPCTGKTRLALGHATSHTRICMEGASRRASRRAALESWLEWWNCAQAPQLQQQGPQRQWRGQPAECHSKVAGE